MNPAFDEADGPPALDLARHLEDAVQRGTLAQDGDLPEDFEQALAGLELVRRASRPRGLTDAETVANADFGQQRTAIWPALAAGVPSADLERGPTIGEMPVKIGRFDVVRELGRGGFGVVILARDPHLQRLVALKLPRVDFLFDLESRQRFDREARLGSLLSHPAIVPILESASEGPVPYIAFAWCQGTSLAHWFEQQGRQVPVDLAARLVARLAHAVHYAHQRGVVHRDLKPSNVLLDLPGDALQAAPQEIVAAVRITDFGLAKSTVARSSELTRPGAIVGTPAYMAPEQATGKLSEVGEPADIYSLGVILYELLTGEPPFRKESDLATLRAVESAVPRAPRHRRREIPRDLDAICLKCLEKSPAARYATAFDLQQDLESFLARRPVQARHITPLERAGRWCLRNPAMATAFGLAMVASVLSFWQWRRADANWRQSQAHLIQVADQRARAERNLDRTEVAIDRMLNDVAQALQSIPRLQSLRQELLRQALALQQELVVDQDDDPKVRFRTAQSWRRMGDIYMMLGDFQNALAAIREASRELEAARLAGFDRGAAILEQARIDLKLARLSRDRDAPADAAQAVRRAVADLEADTVSQVDREGRLLLIDAYWQLGICMEQERQLPEAAASYQAALALIAALPDEAMDQRFRIHQGRILNSLGILHNRWNQPDQAEEYYLESLSILEAIVAARPEHIDLEYDVAITATNLGNRYLRQRNYERAREAYQRAHRHAAGLCGSFPDVVNYRELLIRISSGLGAALFRGGDAAAGEATLTEAIDHVERLPPQVQQTVACREMLVTCYNNLANCRLEIPGHIEEAAQAYSAAAEILDGLCREFPESADYLQRASNLLGNQATLQQRQNQIDQALVLHLRALEQAEKACQLAPTSSTAHDNAIVQLEKLASGYFALRDIAPLLDQIAPFVERFPAHGGRQLAAARIMARALQMVVGGPAQDADGATLDAQAQQFQEVHTSPGQMLGVDAETLRAAARVHLERAIELGALSSDSEEAQSLRQRLLSP